VPLRSVPTLYYVAAVLVLLAWWGRDARGLLLAAACVTIGAFQQARSDREARESAEAAAREARDASGPADPLDG
jgi:hypothetical protein